MAASVSWAVPIAISNTAGLAFGKFVAGSGGTVTVSPGGVLRASGGVILMPSGAGAAAQFAVSGDANLTYAISMPGNGVVSLVSDANSMAVNNFTSSPNLTGKLGVGGTQTPFVGATLGVSGNQTLFVGATLNVGSNQATGSYSGVFDVTVNYT